MEYDLEKVKAYITRELDKNCNKDDIIAVLEKVGVPWEIIEGAFKELKREKEPKPKEIPLPQIKMPKSHLNFLQKKILMVAGLVLLIAVILVGLIFVPVRCDSDSCFTDKANQCTEAIYTKLIEGTTFELKTKDCILTKKIVRMQAGEPEETLNRFLSKSMECPYVRGNFNPLYLTTISGATDACEGELKEAISNYLA